MSAAHSCFSFRAPRDRQADGRTSKTRNGPIGRPCNKKQNVETGNAKWSITVLSGWTEKSSIGGSKIIKKSSRLNKVEQAYSERRKFPLGEKSA